MNVGYGTATLIMGHIKAISFLTLAGLVVGRNSAINCHRLLCQLSPSEKTCVSAHNHVSEIACQSAHTSSVKTAVLRRPSDAKSLKIAAGITTVGSTPNSDD
jgi:hypothetical protein